MGAPSIATVPYVQVAVDTNDANDIAAEQITHIAEQAQDMLGAAQNHILNIKRIQDIPLSAMSFAAGTGNMLIPKVDPFKETAPSVSIPSFTGSVSIDTPELEGKSPREFTLSPPPVEKTARPEKKLSEKPSFTGEIKPPELPAKPDLPPDLLNKINEILNKYSFPELQPPDVSVPAFQGQSTGNIDIPNPRNTGFKYSESLRDTAVTLSLVESLVKSLSEHGFGLSEGGENAIYQRHKSRIEFEYDEAYTKTSAKMAAMGWTIPTGAAMAELAELEEKKNRALMDASYEVTAKNADLTFQDRQEARKVAVQFEGVYREYLAGYYQRSLEAAKALANDLIQIYQIMVEGAKIQLQKYVTEIQLYEAEVRSAMLQLEVFQKKLDAQRTQAELRGQDIQAMLGYITAIEATVKLYEAELQGAMAAVEVDKTRVSLFDTQMRAWMGEVQAYGTEVDAWAKEIQAVGLLTENYMAQVQAYNAEMDGVKTFNSVEESKAKIAIATAQTKLEEFKAQVEAYRAETSAIIAEADANGRLYSAKAQAYSASADAQTKVAEAQARVEAVKAETETKNLALALEQNKVNMENALRESMIDVDALKAIAAHFSQLAASLYSAINVGASISDSFSRSVSDSNSYSASLDNSKSYSYSDKPAS